MVRSLKVPADMTLNSVNAVRSLSMAEKITFEESEIKTIMKNWSNTKAAMMMKSENLRFVMDESGRPYEPGAPEYERAVQETPESLAFEEELIQRFRLQDDEE